MSGYGLYQIIEEVLWKFASEIVVPELVNALAFGAKSIIFWNVQICASCPNVNLLPSLARIINYEDSDVRWAVIMTLEAIGGSEVCNLLLQRLLVEDDDDTISFLQEAITRLIIAF